MLVMHNETLMQDTENKHGPTIAKSLQNLFEEIGRFSKLRREKTRNPEQVSAEIVEARNQIIESIATNGLVSSAMLVSKYETQSFTSVDPSDNRVVFGRALRPASDYKDKQDFINSLAHLLYMTDNSIIPVITERRGQSKEDSYLFKASKESKRLMSERIWSSILVVCQGSKEQELTRESVNLTEILYLLIPADIVQGFGEEALLQLGVPFKTITAETYRSLFHGDPISMPDYETALSQIVEEINASVWVHGVRLPAESDKNND